MPENEHGNSIVPHSSADIPKKDRGEIVHQYERTMVYGGPIPPASMLREYNEVLPGAAERILHMAEQQSEHRIFLEKTVIVGDSKRAEEGLWIGAVIAFVVLAGSIACILMGHDWAGAALGAIDITSIVYVFIHTDKSRKIERAEKAESMKRISTAQPQSKQVSKE